MLILARKIASRLHTLLVVLIKSAQCFLEQIESIIGSRQDSREWYTVCCMGPINFSSYYKLARANKSMVS